MELQKNKYFVCKQTISSMEKLCFLCVLKVLDFGAIAGSSHEV